MLLSLTLKNFILAESLEIEFSRGFGVLTGETGAGKSLLIDALQCVTGARAEVAMIREGHQRAEVSASFEQPSETADCELLARLLEAWSIDNDDTLLLRRVIDATGRNKTYINGSSVTLQQLSQIGSLLLEVHGQNDAHMLRRPSIQRDLLDEYGHCHAQMSKVHQRWQEWQQYSEKLEIIKQDREKLDQQRELLLIRQADLKEVLLPTEWEALNHRHHQLAHVQTLLQNCYRTINLLEEDDTNICHLLQNVLQDLAVMSEIDHQVRPIETMLQSSYYELIEIVRQLHHYQESLESDPVALDQTETAIRHQVEIARKYRTQPEALNTLRQETNTALQNMEEGLNVEGLIEKTECAKQEYWLEAQKLSQMRQKSVESLSEKVSMCLPELGMLHGEFSAQCVKTEPAWFGLETIEFQVKGLAGNSWRPMLKVASGGELSRLSLALFLALHGGKRKTYIFDEVDAGIGGTVAEMVGKMLRKLAQSYDETGLSGQILCVTHLPQVAACAHWHGYVEKLKTAQDQTIAQSTVRVLSTENERLDEIARMLGGQKNTQATRIYAKTMLLDAYKAL